MVVAGSLASDLSCDFAPQDSATESSEPRARTSNPASIKQSLGGVGHNVAVTLHYLKTSVRLCSRIADDTAGSTVLKHVAERGLQTAGIQTLATESHTAQFVAVNDAQKNLVLAMADMEIQEQEDKDFNSAWKNHLDECKPKWVVIDANWNPATIQKWLVAAKASGAQVAYEPVSVAKSKRLFSKPSSDEIGLTTVPNHAVSLATPNAFELASMHDAARTSGLFDREDWWQIIDAMGLSSSGSRNKLLSLTNRSLVDQGIPQQAIQLLPFAPLIMTTLGEHGVLMTQLLRPADERLTSPMSAPHVLSRSMHQGGIVGGVYMRLFPPVESLNCADIVSVNGVGDTFLGVLLAGLAKDHPKDIADLVDTAQKGSVMTLKSSQAVSPGIAALLSEL